MNNLSILYAFLGGAIVGAGAALLLTPEKGVTQEILLSYDSGSRSRRFLSLQLRQQ